MSVSSITLPASAKINLDLRVLGMRPDGFHDLRTIFQTLMLHDTITLIRRRGPFAIECDDAQVPTDHRNLVWKAASLLWRTAVGGNARSAEPHDLLVRLDKQIPAGAGLGGGSADAAVTLLGLACLWRVPLDLPTFHRLAARLGSDVPFFLAGGPALVEGRGERVTPLPPPIGSPLGVLLVTPAIAVRTPAVFAAYDGGVRPGGAATRQTSAHLASELHAGLAASAVLDRAGILASANDLAPATAAVVPELTGFRRAVFRLLGRPIGQSGSGPTLWALYPSLEAAAEAASLVRAAVADGRLEVPGGADPFVHATSIAPGGSPPWTVTPS
jgi:4-diphosphocytidyl-2-C-methyl-D-erythritol kinase